MLSLRRGSLICWLVRSRERRRRDPDGDPSVKRATCSCGRAEVELGMDLCRYCRDDHERHVTEEAALAEHHEQEAYDHAMYEQAQEMARAIRSEWGEGDWTCST